MFEWVLVFLTKISKMRSTAEVFCICWEGFFWCRNFFFTILYTRRHQGLVVKWMARLGATFWNLGVGSYLGVERYLQIMQKQLQKNKPTVRRFHASTQLCTSDAYSDPKQAAKPPLQGCPCSVWILKVCQKQKIFLFWLGGWVEKVSRACHLLYQLERRLFSSSVFQALRQTAQRDSPRHCPVVLRNPSGNVPRLQGPARCV